MVLRAPSSEVVRQSIRGRTRDGRQVCPGLWALTDDTLQPMLSTVVAHARARICVLLVTGDRICAAGHMYFNPALNRDDMAISSNVLGCMPVEIWPDPAAVRAAIVVKYICTTPVGLDKYPSLRDEVEKQGERPFMVPKDLAGDIAAHMTREDKRAKAPMPPPAYMPKNMLPFSPANVLAVVEHGQTHGKRGRTEWGARKDASLTWTKAEAEQLRDAKKKAEEEDEEDFADLNALEMSYAQYLRLHKRVRAEKKKAAKAEREGQAAEMVQTLLGLLPAAGQPQGAEASS